MTLKNYTTISIRTNFNPYEKNDFYEARTNDLTHPLKRSKSINGSGWISTDYRKKIAIDFGGGVGIPYENKRNKFENALLFEMVVACLSYVYFINNVKMKRTNKEKIHSKINWSESLCGDICGL